MNPFGKMSREKKGVALITTLVIIALLVTVVVEFNRIAIADLDVTGNFGDQEKILFLAVSAVNGVKELLSLDYLYTKGDNLLEEWAKGPSYFQAASAMLEEGEIQGTITDEDGKINVNILVNEKGDINGTQKALWERLLAQPRFALNEEEINTIIYSVKDWLDKDEEITGIFGAEDTHYMDKGYRCKNGLLNNLEDLLLIKGITPEIFFGTQDREGIRSCFTVHGDGRININTAPIPVLEALSPDMTEEIAREFDEFRRDETNRPWLHNKLWYQKVWPFAVPLPESLISESSGAFTVNLKVTLRESEREIKAVILRSAEMAKIAYWQENQQ